MTRLTGARGAKRGIALAALASWIAVVTSAGAQTESASPWQEVFRVPAPVDGRWLGAMWASGSSDVFAVGRRCIARFDGTAWSVTPDHSDSGLFDVAGSGATDVYAVGSNETIQRWDGTSWTLEHRDRSRGLRAGYLYAVFVLAPGDAYALGLVRSLHRRPDGTWEVVPTDEAERAVGPSRTAHGPPPSGPCGGRSEPMRTRAGSWFATCERRLWILESEGWRDTALRLPPMRRIVDHLELDATREIVVLTNGEVMFRNGSRWTRELSVGRSSHRLLRVGDVAYLTDRDRVFRRRIAGADSP